MGNALEDVLANAGAAEDDAAALAASAEPADNAETAGSAPVRGPDGRFAAKAGDAAADPQTPVSNAAESTPPASLAPPSAEPGHVPLGVMLDEREKRQSAEKRLSELQERLERERSQWQASNPPSAEETQAAQRYADNLRYSRKFAERQHGAEFVAKVHDWAFEKAERDPYFNAEMAAHDDPYEAAVQAFRRDQILSQVSPDDLDAFTAWRAEKAAAAQAPQAPTTPQPAPAAQPAPPPRSIATVSGTGAMGAGAIPTGPGEAFQSLFRKP